MLQCQQKHVQQCPQSQVATPMWLLQNTGNGEDLNGPIMYPLVTFLWISWE